jgi:outer membrane receptor protein involved in Fe transport
LDTTESQVSSIFDSEQLQSLPLGNGFDSVALLEPGVAPTHDLNFANTNGANFSSNGARGRSNNFELDGQSNNDNSISGPQVFFGNQDAIQQIEVIQSNFSAQYGRNSGTVVNYITK